MLVDLYLNHTRRFTWGSPFKDDMKNIINQVIEQSTSLVSRRNSRKQWVSHERRGDLHHFKLPSFSSKSVRILNRYSVDMWSIDFSRSIRVVNLSSNRN